MDMHIKDWSDKVRNESDVSVKAHNIDIMADSLDWVLKENGWTVSEKVALAVSFIRNMRK